MAEFCTNCGAPLSGVFCGRCGHRAQSASVPADPTSSTPQPVAPAQPAAQPVPQQPTPTQPPITQQSVAQQPAQPASQAQPPQPQATAPPKSSGAGKALLIVGGIILVMVLGAFGAVLYGVHWVRHKVSSITGGSFGSEVSQGNMCKLLSTGELQQMIGVTVERSAEIMDNGDPGCAYYTNPAAFAELQKLAIAQAKRDSEKASQYPDVKNSKGDNPLELLKHTKEMEGIVKGFGLSAPDPSGRVFSFSVNRNFGSGNWGPLRTTLSVVPGFDEVNGVGDHAMIGSFGHAFYVLKGDSVFKLDTMYLPEARARGSEIANKIISRL
ncbi:MAG TPA: zinc ribbon domain-containing protein [Candidatus Angelobacter sp.]